MDKLKNLLYISTPESSSTIPPIMHSGIYGIIITCSANITLKLAPENPEISLHVSILALVQGHDRVTITTEQIHKNPSCTSIITIGAILEDYAHCTYTGTITVPPTGTNSTASHHIRVLQQSPTTRAQAQPILNIQTQQVHCAHGAAMGNFDPLLLQALQARGIAPDKAQRLLRDGFCKSILDSGDITWYHTAQAHLGL